MNRETELVNRIESPEIDPRSHLEIVCDGGDASNHWVKGRLFK